MLNQREKECLRDCSECAAACFQCATACLEEEDPKSMAGCIALDMECADMCRLAAAAIARGDKHVKAICLLCADICQSCATECAKHAMGHCQRCADACRSMAQ